MHRLLLAGFASLAGCGYFTAREAVRQWPEFNYFTLGYVLSTEPHDSALFHDALEWQWRTMDLCHGDKVDRANPGITIELFRTSYPLSGAVTERSLMFNSKSSCMACHQKQ